ncbi:MAG: ISL3 family transposase [Lachnospiraceae bacterium]|nr:ISL3 family transposase [Lachnospiraceae bacterium]
MRYEEIDNVSFFLDKDHFIYDYKETDTLDIYVKSRTRSCSCPSCNTVTEHIHATYQRHLQDVPVRSKPTWLHVNSYKFECDNPECSVSVFTEPLSFARPSQVRTDALNTFILGIAMFLSNEGASNVLKLLGITVSNDTIQRIYDKIGFEDDPDVEGIGVDDVAIRKGQKYATAIYDLKDHHLIALLDGRDGKNLEEWLKGHKKIRMVARDRASAYASAINKILPECIQVADRFHLFQNLTSHLKEIFRSELPEEILVQDGQVLSEAPDKVYRERKVDLSLFDDTHYDNTVPIDEEGNTIVFDDRASNPNCAKEKKRAEDRKKNSR